MAKSLENDFGHGKNTYPPSKGVPGLPEFEFNQAVAKEVKRLLGINGIPTFEAQPFDGNDVPLTARTNLYNAHFAKNPEAIGISDHANANNKASARGMSVYYWYSSAKSKKLAQMIVDEYKKEFPGLPVRGIIASGSPTNIGFHMLRETHAPFVLVEWEFMTNPEAYKLLKSDDYRKRCAKVEAKVVCQWHGVKFREELPKPTFALDVVPEKSAHTYRLAKLVDTVNTDTIKELKAQGYRVIALPEGE